MLRREKIPHKCSIPNTTKAEIISSSSKGMVTSLQIWQVEVRIKLGPGVKLGGLLVIGTERHESRRIDNQLRKIGGKVILESRFSIFRGR